MSQPEIIEISDDEHPATTQRADPRANHPAYAQRYAVPRAAPAYDEHRDEDALLRGPDEESGDEGILLLNLSDEEFLDVGPPPTPRWHQYSEVETEEEEEEEEEEAPIEISDEDEPMPERPPTPRYREHTPEPPNYRAGVTRGQAFQEIHHHRVISGEDVVFREWTATFRTEVRESRDRTIAIPQAVPRPELEPVVEFPPDEAPPTPTRVAVTPSRPTPNGYHVVPRDRWPPKVRQEIEDVRRRSPTGRVRFCRFEGRSQYLVRLWKDRVVVESRPRR